MRSRIDPSPALLSLAERQAGALSHRQACDHGIPRQAFDRLTQHGGWHNLGSGIYSIYPPTSQTWLWAGLLHAGPRATISGTWALHERRLLPEPALPIHLYTPDSHRSTPQWHVHRTIRPSRGELCIAPASVALVDAWPFLDEKEFVTATSEALFRRLTTPKQLLATVENTGRIPQRKHLVRLLADIDVGAQSPLELDFLRRVERAHGLPIGKRQVRSGNSIVDVVYEEFGLIVELDGVRGHSGFDVFKDMYRDNAHAAHGIASLRYGSWDISRRCCEVAWQVGEALQARGWLGLPMACRHCRKQRS